MGQERLLGGKYNCRLLECKRETQRQRKFAIWTGCQVWQGQVLGLAALGTGVGCFWKPGTMLRVPLLQRNVWFWVAGPLPGATHSARGRWLHRLLLRLGARTWKSIGCPHLAPLTGPLETLEYPLTKLCHFAPPPLKMAELRKETSCLREFPRVTISTKHPSISGFHPSRVEVKIAARDSTLRALKSITKTMIFKGLLSQCLTPRGKFLPWSHLQSRLGAFILLDWQSPYTFTGLLPQHSSISCVWNILQECRKKLLIPVVCLASLRMPQEEQAKHASPSENLRAASLQQSYFSAAQTTLQRLCASTIRLSCSNQADFNQALPPEEDPKERPLWKRSNNTFKSPASWRCQYEGRGLLYFTPTSSLRCEPQPCQNVLLISLIE